MSEKPNELCMDIFTQKEKRVAELLSRGKSRKDIAQILCISENTAKTHMHNIFGKSGVKSQREFMALYFETFGKKL